jgi:hypothetical protein
MALLGVNLRPSDLTPGSRKLIEGLCAKSKSRLPKLLFDEPN